MGRKKKRKSIYGFTQTIKNLEQGEKESYVKGFKGDATESAFRRHTLILLQKIAKRLVRRQKRGSCSAT